jgi:hypothetical protein
MLQIEVRHQKNGPDLWAPVFVCDWCGKKIERAEEGMYQFWMAVGDAPHDPTLVTTHKIIEGQRAACNQLWEKAHEREGYLHGWMDMANLMGYLINNLHLDWKKLVEEFAPKAVYDQLIPPKKGKSRKTYYEEIGKRI